MSSIEIPLGPNGIASTEQIQQRSQDLARSDRTIANIGSASLTISWPAESGAPAPAVLICPGGGYGMLVIDKEGHDLARWLNAHGYVAAVLKYRLPRPPLTADAVPWPIEDATRALRLLRHHSAEWRIRAVGIMGSSAGGHLAATISTHPGAENQPGNSRPDFQILLYPVISFTDSDWAHAGSRRNLLGPDPDPALRRYYSNELQVTPDTPPAFVVHATDDGVVNVEHARRYHAALQAANVLCEYIELTGGGHGFGLGVNGGEPLRWPPLCLDWLQRHFPTK